DNACASQWALLLQLQPRHQGYRGLALPLQLSREEQRQLSQSDTQLVFKNQRWQSLLRWQMGGVTIAEEQLPVAASDIGAALVDHLWNHITQQGGLGALQWSAPAWSLLVRARLLAAAGLLTETPNLSDEVLLASLNSWLQPFLNEQTRLESLPLLAGLEFYLGYDPCQAIARQI